MRASAGDASLGAGRWSETGGGSRPSSRDKQAAVAQSFMAKDFLAQLAARSFWNEPFTEKAGPLSAAVAAGFEEPGCSGSQREKGRSEEAARHELENLNVDVQRDDVSFGAPRGDSNRTRSPGRKVSFEDEKYGFNSAIQSPSQIFVELPTISYPADDASSSAPSFEAPKSAVEKDKASDSEPRSPCFGAPPRFGATQDVDATWKLKFSEPQQPISDEARGRKTVVDLVTVERVRQQSRDESQSEERSASPPSRSGSGSQADRASNKDQMQMARGKPEVLRPPGAEDDLSSVGAPQGHDQRHQVSAPTEADAVWTWMYGDMPRSEGDARSASAPSASPASSSPKRDQEKPGKPASAVPPSPSSRPLDAGAQARREEELLLADRWRYLYDEEVKKCHAQEERIKYAEKELRSEVAAWREKTFKTELERQACKDDAAATQKLVQELSHRLLELEGRGLELQITQNRQEARAQAECEDQARSFRDEARAFKAELGTLEADRKEQLNILDSRSRSLLEESAEAHQSEMSALRSELDAESKRCQKAKSLQKKAERDAMDYRREEKAIALLYASVQDAAECEPSSPSQTKERCAQWLLRVARGGTSPKKAISPKAPSRAVTDQATISEFKDWIEEARAREREARKKSDEEVTLSRDLEAAQRIIAAQEQVLDRRSLEAAARLLQDERSSASRDSEGAAAAAEELRKRRDQWGRPSLTLIPEVPLAIQIPRYECTNVGLVSARIVYTIVVQGPGFTGSIERSYEDFKALYETMSNKPFAHSLQAFPYEWLFTHFSSTMMERRRRQLESYLSWLCTHSRVLLDEAIWRWLATDDVTQVTVRLVVAHKVAWVAELGRLIQTLEAELIAGARVNRCVHPALLEVLREVLVAPADDYETQGAACRLLGRLLTKSARARQVFLPRTPLGGAAALTAICLGGGVPASGSGSAATRAGPGRVARDAANAIQNILEELTAEGCASAGPAASTASAKVAAGKAAARPPRGSRSVGAAPDGGGVVSSGECCVCLDKVCSHALLPCGHFCTCMDCADFLVARGSTCPVCRRGIEKTVQIFV